LLNYLLLGIGFLLRSMVFDAEAIQMVLLPRPFLLISFFLFSFK
jgi:hypothetical protein